MVLDSEGTRDAADRLRGTNTGARGRSQVELSDGTQSEYDRQWGYHIIPQLVYF